jgi:glycosyltransferase involved in cell wall biosynthesis
MRLGPLPKFIFQNSKVKVDLIKGQTCSAEVKGILFMKDIASEPKMTKRIRVLQIISSWGTGGTENGLSLMGGLFSEKGIELKITNLCPGQIPDNWWQQYGADYKSFPCKALTLKSFFILYRFLKKEKPDVIDLYGLRTNLLGRVVGKLAGVPVIISGVRQTDDWRKWYHVMLDRLTSPLVDCYVSNSQAGYRMTLEREKVRPDKVKIIYNGVDLKKYDVGVNRKDILKSVGVDDPEKTVFITPAAFRYEKGHETLITAIAKYEAMLDNCIFLFAGDGLLRAKIEQMVKDLNLQSKIIFLGNRTDVIVLLKASNVFVLPSYFEGLPRSVAEAMAAGLPVIATAVSGTPELVDNGVTGLLVPPKDYKALGDAIVRLKNDKDLANSMGNAGKKKAYENYDVNHVASQMADLYKKILHEKCPS